MWHRICFYKTTNYTNYTNFFLSCSPVFMQPWLKLKFV